MSTRRLFITNLEDLGVGPSDTSTKDKIVVFLGCKISMIMRRVWSLPSRHQMLTPRSRRWDYRKESAYVQNYMEREEFREPVADVWWYS